MSKQVTINVPFKAQLDIDSNGFAYVEDTRISASCYAPPPKARKVLSQMIEREVDAALTQAANWRKRVIGTNDGVILIVRYGSGSWGYDIAGPDRAHGGSCIMQGEFNDALIEARKHAVSSYNGIAWESSI